MPEKWVLQQLQQLPLKVKVVKSQLRIKEWYERFDGNVCISFSGGKDSTVLAHLVHDIYPDVPLVFSNTGLEYPEIQSFARAMGAEFVRPDMMFNEVLSVYGYPLISKEISSAIYYARRIKATSGNNSGWENKPSGKRNQLTGFKTMHMAREEMTGQREYNEQKSRFNKEKWLPICQEAPFMISSECCSIMKKSPLKKYQRATKRYPYLGILAEESQSRERAWVMHGCNAFDSKKPTSQPMAFWTEQDVLNYIRDNNIQIASVYGDIVSVDKDGFKYEPMPGTECKLKCSGCQRTGCIFCACGAHLEKEGESRFKALAKTHQKQYEYCIGGGQWVDNPHYDPTAPEKDGEWKNWNPKKIWVPSKDGLGMGFVFDTCNKIMGEEMYKY